MSEKKRGKMKLNEPERQNSLQCATFKAVYSDPQQGTSNITPLDSQQKGQYYCIRWNDGISTITNHQSCTETSLSRRENSRRNVPQQIRMIPPAARNHAYFRAADDVETVTFPYKTDDFDDYESSVLYGNVTVSTWEFTPKCASVKFNMHDSVSCTELCTKPASQLR